MCCRVAVGCRGGRALAAAQPTAHSAALGQRARPPGQASGKPQCAHLGDVDAIYRTRRWHCLVVVTIVRSRRACGSAAVRQLEQPAAAASEAARSGRPATAAGESKTSIPFIHCSLCSLCGCAVYGPLAAASSSRVQRHNGRERHFLPCARLAQRKARATQAHRRHKDSTAIPYSKTCVLAA